MKSACFIVLLEGLQDFIRWLEKKTFNKIHLFNCEYFINQLFLCQHFVKYITMRCSVAIKLC